MRRTICGIAAACLVAAASRPAFAQDKPTGVEPKREDTEWLVHRFDLGSSAFHVPGIDMRRESDCGTWDDRAVGYGCITSIALSADGRRLVAVGGTGGGTVIAFDAGTGRAERSWCLDGAPPPDQRSREESGAGCVAAIGTGTVIVLGWKHDNQYPPGQNATVVHILRDDDPPLAEGAGRTTAVAELPGTPLSVVAAEGESGACWIATTEALYHGSTAGPAPRFENVHTEKCTRGIAFGRGALIRLPDSGYSLLQQEGAQLVAHQNAAAGDLLAMTPDGQWYANYWDGIEVYEVARQSRLPVRHFDITGPAPHWSSHAPWSCALSPDGAAVAWVTSVEHADRTEWMTEVYSVRTRERLATIPALPHAPGGLAFSADGTVVFLTDRTVVRRFDSRSGREILPPTGHLHPPHVVRMSINEKLVVSASEDRICVWSADDGKAISTVAVPPMVDVVDIAVRRDPAGPQFVAVLRHGGRGLGIANEVARWRVADGGEVDRDQLKNNWSPFAALSDDGFHVAFPMDSLDLDGIVVRDPARGGTTRIVERCDKRQELRGLTINADGTTLVVESEEAVYTLRIFGNEVTKTVLLGTNRLDSCAVSSDGRSVAGTFEGEAVRRWDLDGRGASPYVLGPDAYGPSVRSVGFGHHVLATIRDRLFVVGSYAAAEPPLLRESVLRAPVTCASSLDHPGALVTGLGDGTLAVWRIDWSAKPTPPR